MEYRTGRRLIRRAEALRIIDQDVEPAPDLCSIVHKTDNLLAMADIALKGHRAPAGGGDVSYD
jgi:hypothetical protein